MNWYKISQKMFELFGLDTFLSEQFEKNLPIWREQVLNSKRTLRKNNLIAKININEYLDKILARHGMPKNIEKPNPVLYLVATIDEKPENYGTNAIINDALVLGVSVDKDFKLSKLQQKELPFTIGHELQELIKSLYVPIKEKDNKSRIEYLQDEIQSISYEKAMLVMKNIVVQYNLESKMSPEINQKYVSNKDDIVKNEVIKVCNEFFEDEKYVIGSEIPNNIKKKYYMAVLGNVQKMYDDWILNHELV